MPARIALLCAVLAIGLSGCSINRSLLEGEGPLFGNGPVLPFLENVNVRSNSTPVAQPAIVHTQAHESWGEPEVIPVGLTGPQAVADTDGPYLLDSGDRLRIFVYGQPSQIGRASCRERV